MINTLEKLAGWLLFSLSVLMVYCFLSLFLIPAAHASGTCCDDGPGDASNPTCCPTPGWLLRCGYNGALSICGPTLYPTEKACLAMADRQTKKYAYKHEQYKCVPAVNAPAEQQ